MACWITFTWAWCDGAAHPSAGNAPRGLRRPVGKAAAASAAVRRSAPAIPGGEEACGAAGWAKFFELQTCFKLEDGLTAALVRAVSSC